MTENEIEEDPTGPVGDMPREDVIEITCDLADEALRTYWANQGITTPIDVWEEDSTSYTEMAQDRFDKIYDWVEGEVIDLIKANPTLNSLEIEALYKEVYWGTKKDADEELDR